MEFFTFSQVWFICRTFKMDDFKRCYSNEDESTSIKYFWEHFDAENYSIWLGEYKYNDELQKVFMSCNLISGKQNFSNLLIICREFLLKNSIC